MAAVHCETPELTAVVQQLIAEFRDLFPADLPAGLPPDRGVHHAIPLQQDTTPPAARQHRLSQAENQEMRQQVAELLRKGWIQPYSSPYGAPILFVSKKMAA